MDSVTMRAFLTDELTNKIVEYYRIRNLISKRSKREDLPLQWPNGTDITARVVRFENSAIYCRDKISNLFLFGRNQELIYVLSDQDFPLRNITCEN